MPTCTNIRILARQGKLSQQDAEKVLNLPISFGDIRSVVLKNKDVMIQELKNDFGVPFHIQTIESFQELPNRMSDLVVFDDEQNATELVFGIAVNR